ncbi:Vacuolar protein 8 [Marasmius sp. AFHP31]|nr:Vacuolar protein 8 [Marasmius sp. AFHP31]
MVDEKRAWDLDQEHRGLDILFPDDWVAVVFFDAGVELVSSARNGRKKSGALTKARDSALVVVFVDDGPSSRLICLRFSGPPSKKQQPRPNYHKLLLQLSSPCIDNSRSFSDKLDLQRSAALAFAEISEKEARPAGRATLDPILFLLSSHDAEVQRAASAALGNLAFNTDIELLIVKFGALEPLIRQMLIPNVRVQCNAVGCVTNLATHDDNKTKIPKSGALVPLTRLARLKDMRVQRNATGALLNMTHSEGCRQQLVNTGAILVLVSLLDSHETDVQYYFTTALSNVAVDERTQVGDQSYRIDGEHLESTSLKARCQAALALRNLASDEKYQLEIVRADGLSSLLRPLQSAYLPLILSFAACVRNLSIHPQNESPIIESGFLQPLIDLLSFKDNGEIQCHAISTLRNLAASSEKNKAAIMKAGAAESIQNLALEVPMNVQSEMTTCHVAVLTLSDDLKGSAAGDGYLRGFDPSHQLFEL